MQASKLLEGEYAKRIWLDKIDKENFANFTEPYRENGVVNMAKIEQNNEMDAYNLLLYLEVSSSLKKEVLEAFISKRGKGQYSESLDRASQMKQLKELEGKTELRGISGGFVDEVDISEAGGSSHLIIFDESLDTTGKTVEEQMSMYEKELERVMEESIQKENGSLDSNEFLSSICKKIEMAKGEISSIINQALEESKKEKESTSKYQKILAE